MPLGVETLFVVAIENVGDEGGTTEAAVKIMGADGTKEITTSTVSVGVGCTALAFAEHTFKNKGSYQISATANPNNTVNEWSTDNNSKATTVAVNELPKAAAPDEKAAKRNVPAKPSAGNGSKIAGWNDLGISYVGNLHMTASTYPTTLKSGYGFTVKVQVGKSTSYSKPKYVYKPQKVYMYLPEYGYEKAIELKETSDGIWELPVNSKSVTSASKWYVPIWWPDRSEYTVKIEAVGAFSPGERLDDSLLKTVTIDSNMYTDDYSTN